MTPNELYAREPERIVPAIERGTPTWDGGYLEGCYYNHVPELDSHAKYKQCDRVMCHIYKDFDFDGRRFWRLAAIYFDEKPVMIVQNAGREGDDWAKRFITDFPAYCKMLAHIMSLREPDKCVDLDVVDPDKEVKGKAGHGRGYTLTDFYGNKLDGWFERYNY